MYRTFLLLHSWNRWIILILGVVVVVVALSRWLSKHESSALTGKLSLFFIIVLDLQLLLGVALYFVSPLMETFLSAPGAAMRDSVLRYWGVEHTFAMLFALALAHVGRVSFKRAATALDANRRAAIYFGISILVILLASPWPVMRYGRALFAF
jgi:hypothetical protein